MPSTKTYVAKTSEPLSAPASGKSRMMCTKCHSGIELYVLEAHAFSQLHTA
jgi:hypothetical protein